MRTAIVQDSVDNGLTWRPVYVVGIEVKFTSKQKAKDWFKLFEEANNIDWRVGFLLRCRDGRHYRLAYRDSGDPVKY